MNKNLIKIVIFVFCTTLHNHFYANEEASLISLKGERGFKSIIFNFVEIENSKKEWRSGKANWVRHKPPIQATKENNYTVNLNPKKITIGNFKEDTGFSKKALLIYFTSPIQPNKDYIHDGDAYILFFGENSNNKYHFKAFSCKATIFKSKKQLIKLTGIDLSQNSLAVVTDDNLVISKDNNKAKLLIKLLKANKSNNVIDSIVIEKP